MLGFTSQGINVIVIIGWLSRKAFDGGFNGLTGKSFEYFLDVDWASGLSPVGGQVIRSRSSLSRPLGQPLLGSVSFLEGISLRGGLP